MATIDGTGVATATDECNNPPAITYNDVVTPGNCTNTFTVARTWTATDACGNDTMCVQTIVVQDTTKPVLTCPADVTIDCPGDTAATAIGTGIATATDECNIQPIITYSDVVIPGDCDGAFTVERTWTATDACGNDTMCVQMILVQDTTAPVLTCPVDVTLNCPSDTTPAVSGMATATEECTPDAIMSYSDVVTPGDCEGAFTVTRTWVAADSCGNDTMCVQTIVVQDTVKPVLACPADITLNCPADTSTSNTDTAFAYDPVCGVLFINELHYDNASTDVGEFIEVAGTAGTDLSGYSLVLYNGSNGTVYSTTALTGILPDMQNGFGVQFTSYPSNGIQNGGPDGIALVGPYGNVLQFISYEGSFTANGGPADGMTSVDIGVTETSTTPIGSSLNLVGSGVMYGDFTWSGPSAESPGMLNPGQTFEADTTLVTYRDSVEAGTCPGEFVVFRIWTTIDDCGNDTSCIQTIVVQDTTAPMLSCPADITLNCPTDTNTMITGMAMATEECTPDAIISYTDAVTLGNCVNTFTVMRTWTAVDSCGNDTMCIQTIVVQDTTHPILDLELSWRHHGYNRWNRSCNCNR
jgi:hypothetical protein